MTITIDPQLSLFQLIDRSATRPLFTHFQAGMITLTDEFEQVLIDTHVRVKLFAGFRRFSNFIPFAERYRELGREVRSVWVFGYPDVQPPDLDNVIYVNLPANSPLMQEWFTVADSPDFFSAIVAQEITPPETPYDERQFRGLWTFDVNTVALLHETLTRALGLTPEMGNSVRRNYQHQLEQVGLTLERITNRLQIRNARLMDAQAQRAESVSMLVHDLKNPLGGMTGFMDLVEHFIKENNPDMAMKYLQQVRHNNADLTRMIGDILDLERMEASQLPFNVESVNIFELIDEVRQQFSGVIQSESKSLTIDVDDSLNFNVDRNIMVRVMSNLVVNANKYTARRTGKIEIRAFKESEKNAPDDKGDTIVITITDNGQGIAPEMHEAIFAKFRQVAGNSNERRGYGLGLAFCRASIESFGGTIHVESELSKGATFVIRIPEHRPSESC